MSECRLTIYANLSFALSLNQSIYKFIKRAITAWFLAIPALSLPHSLLASLLFFNN